MEDEKFFIQSNVIFDGLPNCIYAIRAGFHQNVPAKHNLRQMPFKL